MKQVIYFDPRATGYRVFDIITERGFDVMWDKSDEYTGHNSIHIIFESKEEAFRYALLHGSFNVTYAEYAEHLNRMYAGRYA